MANCKYIVQYAIYIKYTHNIRNVIFVFLHFVFARFDAAEETKYDRVALKTTTTYAVSNRAAAGQRPSPKFCFFILLKQVLFVRVELSSYTVCLCAMCIIKYSLYCANTLPKKFARKRTQQTHYCFARIHCFVFLGLFSDATFKNRI